ncbi:MAG: DUF2796 domain-containing protein [Aliivibrio sp.]|uniref:zinc uptake protein ZrgA n=1 Tax=Aliivibrio sp. TaxID=1872443 RepID=UPI001A36D80E|nr:DUF2796 domain-containing protein [Aliivibrio sp.]
MSTYFRFTHAALLVAGVVATFSSSAEQHQQDFIQHQAHQHGVVTINIAQDDHDLLLEITAPGSDVVGFEHPPESELQKKQLETAVQLLKQADQVFTLPESAECSIEHVAVTHTLVEHQDEEDNDHLNDTHHNHDEHAEHAEHAEHGEFSIEYHFHCKQIDKIKSLDTQWFTLFPNSQKADVHLLSEYGQSATSINKQHSRISF